MDSPQREHTFERPLTFTDIEVSIGDNFMWHYEEKEKNAIYVRPKGNILQIILDREFFKDLLPTLTYRCWDEEKYVSLTKEGVSSPRYVSDDTEVLP